MLTILAAITFHRAEQFPVRWFYMGTNLAVAENAQNVIHIMDRAHLAGYNGMVITDSKFAFLDRVGQNYFDNVAKVRKKAAEFGIEIVPAVADMGWSSGLLSHDVNLIEGQPVKRAPFVVKDGQLAPVREVNYANGNMESGSKNRLDNFVFQDGPGTSSFLDTNVKHGGNQSIRFENFKVDNGSGNARIMHGLTVHPWQQYRVSLWI